MKTFTADVWVSENGVPVKVPLYTYYCVRCGHVVQQVTGVQEWFYSTCSKCGHQNEFNAPVS